MDPVLVLLTEKTESNDIMLVNSAADKIFERHNLEESTSSVKLFTVLKEEENNQNQQLSIEELTRDDTYLESTIYHEYEDPQTREK